jgi:hypothetical protein
MRGKVIMPQVKLENRTHIFWFYEKVVQLLALLKNSSPGEDKIIPFPKIFQLLGRYFHFTRDESWKLLKSLREQGFISIVPFKGVVIQEVRISNPRESSKSLPRVSLAGIGSDQILKNKRGDGYED